MTQDEKLDQLVVDVATLKADVGYIRERFPGLGDRVSALEAWKWRTLGAAGVMMAVVLPLTWAVIQR